MTELNATYDQTRDGGAEPANAASGKWFARHQALLISLSMIVAVAIASAWLAFPYLLEGRGVIADVGSSVQDERRARAISIGQFLTRVADGPGEAEVDVLYATPRYFEASNRSSAVAQYRPDRYLVFVVNESTHITDLPMALPEVVLVVGGREYAPADVDGPIDIVHHRSTTVRFALQDDTGQSILSGDTRELQLRLQNGWDEANTLRTVSWPVPIEYPDDLAAGLWSPAMIFALSAGLLSAVLTPCLLQLLAVYFVTLTGLSVEEAGRSGAASSVAGRRVFYVALSFVLGFTILYTGAGALIGYAGKEMQILSAEWSRSASIVAGLLVIAMGLWFGVRAKAPVVCKIPTPQVMKTLDQKGFVSSALVAAGFSLGCMTCFSGAIIATLLVYVGALGSASIGALVLFLFSLGVAIPFLAAALFLSRVMPAMTRLTRYAPQIGFVSMVMMVGFGVLLVSDNFHQVSSLIYPWLRLS